VGRPPRAPPQHAPPLGPILFDLEIPPSDYAPEGADEGELVEEDEE